MMRLLSLASLCLAAGVFSGCSASYYKNEADDDVYDIIAQVEDDIFGKPSGFKIDTAVSERDPDEVSAQEILDERTNFEVLELNIDQTIDQALGSSRTYQTEKEQLYLTALALTGAQHDFRPQFFGRSRATRSRLSDGEQTGSVDSAAGVGLLLLSGADLGLTIANDLFRYYTGDPRRSAISAISANLFQPLLRGAGRDVVGERLTQAERDVVYAVREFSDFQDTFASGVVTQYLRLLAQKESIYNAYNRYQSSVTEAEYLRARSVDRASLTDVGEAEQSELAAKNVYINTIASFRTQLDRFKIELGLPQTVDLRLDDGELERLEKAGLLPVRFDSEEGFLLSLRYRLPLLNEIDRYEDSKRQLRVAANELKADLGIFGDARLDSEGETDYDSFDIDTVRANVGVELDLPLDRLRERNQYRAAVVGFERAVRALGEAFDRQRNDIELGLRDLEQFRQNYENAKASAELADRRVEGTRIRLQAGDVDFRSLNDAQNDLLVARDAVTEALVDYFAARLDLLAQVGVLDSEPDSFWLDGSMDDAELPEPEDVREFGGAPVGGPVVPPDELFPKNS